MNETWIILGATSSMAQAFARKVAAEGQSLILAGRNTDDLGPMATDCALRGAAHVDVMTFDARSADSFSPILEMAAKRDGVINAAVFVGSMPEQSAIDEDPSLIGGTIEDSFAGPARFLQALAPLMEARERGAIVGVGSVAGDRGRVGNYVYGAAKAGFHTYLAGLRNRLGRKSIHVLTVKPGFVDTAMTWGLEGLFLVASPEKVANDIWRGVQKKRNTIYTPWFWFGIMSIIRSIPEPIFKKLSV